MVDFIRIIHYMPILTTVISAVFTVLILKKYATKPEAKHLLWWGIGIAVYGAGTLVESLTTLFGWNIIFFKTWYIVGALLGGAPLALGTVYLLLGKRAGDIGVGLLLVTVATTSVFVILSPIRWELVDNNILNSKVLEWQSIRRVSPFINSLAALFLIGGAIYSAIVYFRKQETRHRAIGNVYIALGALLPGIGGFYSRLGHTEVLYVGELVGIVLIWYGYQYCKRPIPGEDSVRYTSPAGEAAA